MMSQNRQEARDHLLEIQQIQIEMIEDLAGKRAR